MDDRIRRIDTPQKCEIFAKNVIQKGREDLANEALKRAVELRAEAHGAKSAAEKEALQAIYGYEETLRVKNGKKTRATDISPVDPRNEEDSTRLISYLGRPRRSHSSDSSCIGYCKK